MNFITVNNILVNLQNVSNVNVQTKKNLRIIFNLGYTVGINTDKDKRISDYVYWDFTDFNDFSAAYEGLQSNQYVQENFFVVSSFLINKNQISSVKFIDKEKRVVFNMSHPVTFKGKYGEQLTSEFIYVNSASEAEYESLVLFVKSVLQ